jgi:hypothetical protein
MDAAFESMLKDLPNLKSVADYYLTYLSSMESVEINKEKISTGYTERLRYSKADFQPELLTELDITGIYSMYGEDFDIKKFAEYMDDARRLKQEVPLEHTKIQNYMRHLCLLRKGEMIIPEMLSWVKENALKTISTQRPITISNESGDTFRGFLDAIIDTKDHGTILYDLKTSASPTQDYPEGCADLSPQLSIYAQETGVYDVGYLIFDKNIRKKDPRVRIREVYGKITEQQLDKTFEDIDNAVKDIKAGNFPRNLESCNKYGGCPYAGYCFKNKDMTNLVDLGDNKTGGSNEL